VIGSHQILGQAIAVKKALEREQKEMIAAGGTVRGRGTHYCLFVGIQSIKQSYLFTVA